jgi:hypothetical protein
VLHGGRASRGRAVKSATALWLGLALATTGACSGGSRNAFRSEPLEGEDPALRAWSRLSLVGDELEHYDSLASMTKSSSIVIWASVEDVEPGPIYGEPGDFVQIVMATLRVREVLAGEGRKDGEALKLGLAPGDVGADIEKAYEDIVGDTGVFFLRRVGEAIPALGIPPNEEDLALEAYRNVSSQGVFLNDGGRVTLAFWRADLFPSQLSGLPFDEFVARVRGFEAGP